MPPAAAIKLLCRAGGGSILTDAPSAVTLWPDKKTIVLWDPSVCEQTVIDPFRAVVGVHVLPAKWLLDSISAFELQPMT